MKSLDFRDWMKISSDGKSTTLQHKKGHIMMIAHAALPKIQQEQLKRLKMAEGGAVDDVPEPDQKNAEAMQKGATESGVQPKQWARNFKEGLGLAKGGKIKLAEGTPEPVSATSDEKAAPDSDSESKDSSMSPNPSTTININAAPAPAAAPAPSSMMMAPIPQLPSPMANAPRYTGTGPGQGTEQIQVPEVPVAPGGSPRQQIVNQNTAGLAQQANVQAAAGAERAKIEDSYLKAKQAQIDEQNQNIQQVRNATQRLDAYTQANGINPNAWWENKSTPHKVANMIGLILGGMQGGLNGTGNNPALNQLMMQQERDIQAQKDRMEQQKTVYGAYHQLYGDNVIASNLAAVSWNDMMKHQVDQTAARLATAQAGANAKIVDAKFAADNFDKLGAVGQRMSAIKKGQIAPQPYGQNGAQNKSAQAPSQNRAGASASWGDQASSGGNHLLPRDAYSQLDEIAWTPKAKDQTNPIRDQITGARQAEKTMDFLDHSFEVMAQKRNFFGDLSNRINPTHLGAGVAAGVTALGAAGTLPTGGASLAAAIPAAIGAGGAATALAAGAKTLARAIGGKGQTDYETAHNGLVEVLKTIPGMGNELAQDLANKYAPGEYDGPEQIKNKLQELKNVIRTRVPVDLIEHYMNNRNKNKGM